MALITQTELLTFAKLDLSIVKQVDVEQAIAYAEAEVLFRSPQEDTSRSQRAEPLRKHAALYLGAACIYLRISAFILSTAPAKQTLQTLGIAIGPDAPSPSEVEYALIAASRVYREESERILTMITSAGATLLA